MVRKCFSEHQPSPASAGLRDCERTTIRSDILLTFRIPLQWDSIARCGVASPAGAQTVATQGRFLGKVLNQIRGSPPLSGPHQLLQHAEVHLGKTADHPVGCGKHRFTTACAYGQTAHASGFGRCHPTGSIFKHEAAGRAQS